MKIKKVKHGTLRWWVRTNKLSIMVYSAKEFSTKRRIEVLGENNPYPDKTYTYIDVYI